MSDAETKVPSYRDKDTSIQPLPAFVTVEMPDQVERPADDQAGHPRLAARHDGQPEQDGH